MSHVMQGHTYKKLSVVYMKFKFIHTGCPVFLVAKSGNLLLWDFASINTMCLCKEAWKRATQEPRGWKLRIMGDGTSLVAYLTS